MALSFGPTVNSLPCRLNRRTFSESNFLVARRRISLGSGGLNSCFYGCTRIQAVGSSSSSAKKNEKELPSEPIENPDPESHTSEKVSQFPDIVNTTNKTTYAKNAKKVSKTKASDSQSETFSSSTDDPMVSVEISPDLPDDTAVPAVDELSAKRILELESANSQLRQRVAELEAALALSEAVSRASESAFVEEETSVTVPSPAVERTPATWNSIEWPSPEDSVPFWKLSSPIIASSPPADLSNIGSDIDVLQIVHITAEMAPFAKVGGLADVVTGLSRACLSRGHDVVVLLPFYDCLDEKSIENLRLERSYGSYHKGDWVGVQAFRGTVSGVPVALLKPENHFFRGSRIYGGTYNELEAYLFFGRASLEYLQVSGWNGDIVHLHEWHTGVVGPLYWDMYHWLNLKHPRLVFTIHNMEHQGECKWEELSWTGLDGQSYATVERCVDERTIGHNPERLSLLKGGIVYSNAVTTVSPTYVKETLCSGWLSSTLHVHNKKYFGILNGIDTDIWDPATDPLLPAPFNGDDLQGKALCKHYLQRGLGLNLEVPAGGVGGVVKRIPLVVCVTRLVAQKGIHLIRHAIFRTVEQGGQFVLLGSSPVAHIQADFERLAAEFSSSGDVRLILTYSDSLSHYLFAAGDIVLVPSMFEPCGLTQMIGMRYGTVPVVRRTGGLADTVFDVDNPNNAITNGFVFDGMDEGSLNSALDRALDYYINRSDWWADLTVKVMKIDNSWNKSAGEYLDLYRSVRV